MDTDKPLSKITAALNDCFKKNNISVLYADAGMGDQFIGQKIKSWQIKKLDAKYDRIRLLCSIDDGSHYKFDMNHINWGFVIIIAKKQESYSIYFNKKSTAKKPGVSYYKNWYKAIYDNIANELANQE